MTQLFRRSHSAMIALFAGLLLAAPAAALSGGPDAFGYTFVDSDEANGPAFDFEVPPINRDATTSGCDDCLPGARRKVCVRIEPAALAGNGTCEIRDVVGAMNAP